MLASKKKSVWFMSDTVLWLQPKKPIKFELTCVCIILQLEGLIDIRHGNKYFGW